MKKILGSFFFLSVSAGMLLPGNVSAQNRTSGPGVTPPAAAAQQDPYRLKMTGLMTELKNAKTPEQRQEIQGRIAKARQEYRAAHPVKELTQAEKDARRLKMEESLKKDPYQWEMYQLRQSLAGAKTREEREGYLAKIKTLGDKHATEEEAKLTPEQRAARQARKVKNAQMQAELKPLNEKLRQARTPADRKTLQAQMQEIYKKYR